MKYSTVVVAAFVVTGLLVAGAMTGTAQPEDPEGANTFTLEIEYIGGPGETCVFDEGELNRVEVSEGELENVSIYSDSGQMQINAPHVSIDVVLWTDGSNPAVDAIASANGTCVENDIPEVVVEVVDFNSDLSTPEGAEILTGDDVEEAPPPRAGIAPPEPQDTINNTINDTVDTINDTVNNVTEDPVGLVNDTVNNLTEDPTQTVDDLVNDTDHLINDTDQLINDTIGPILNPLAGATDDADDDATTTDDAVAEEAEEDETTVGT